MGGRSPAPGTVHHHGRQISGQDDAAARRRVPAMTLVGRARRTARPRARRGAVLVGAVLLAVLVAVGSDLLLHRPPASPPRQPEAAQLEPPEGVEVPRLGAADPVAQAADPAPLRLRAVRRALAPHLGDRALGPHVLARVAPLTGEGPRFGVGGDADVAVPASTTKLVTAAAVLQALGPSRTFVTRVVRPTPGRVVLVGGGDPFLASSPPDASTYPARADVRTLARRTARALRADGVRRVRLGFDDSLFTGPAVSPRWPADYVPDVVTPVHALWVDQGLGPEGRSEDPPRSAAVAFAASLRANGVRVAGRPSATRVARRAGTVASVASAPLSGIVEQTLQVSDNEAAEVLLRQAAIATGRPGSFSGGRAAVRELLSEMGVELRRREVLWDGSGLSRESRLRPATLVDLLRAASAPGRPELRAVVTGLPVAGYLGSLADRFDSGDPRAPGRVRAKTGTLSNVFSLAGIASGPDGAPVVFALMADRIRLPRTLAARQAMDEAAAALAGCDCTR